MSGTSNLLKSIHTRQSECVQAFGGKEIKAKLVSPFITGLGVGHPTETGMILDRNTGVPYIPASSIKGVLRTAYAVNIANENGIADDSELDKIFGSQEKKGKIVILDAYPEKTPTIQNDIMNPHFGKYYGGENTLPLENENPVPIKFLSVQQGCVFVFRYIITDENSEKSEYVEKAFDTAFSVVGFGGKTSIGYGRFERVDSDDKSCESKTARTTSSIEDEFRKLKIEKLKARKNTVCQGIVCKIENGKIYVKVHVQMQNSNEPQFFEIEASSIPSTSPIGQKVEILLNNFNSKTNEPISGSVQKLIKEN